MKSEKILTNDFNIEISFSKDEALSILTTLKQFRGQFSVNSQAHNLVNELEKYSLVKEDVKENVEKDVLMRFYYKNKNGETSIRKVKVSSVESYGAGDLKVVGFDVHKDALRTFLFSRFVPNTVVIFEVDRSSVTLSSQLSGSKSLFLSYLMQAQSKANRVVYKL